MPDYDDELLGSEEPDFEWEDAPTEGGSRGRRSRRRSRGTRRSSGSGGRGRGLNAPNGRLIGLVIAAVLLIVVIAFVVRDCQRDQLVDSYRSYVSEVNAIVTESAKQGDQLRTILNNQRGQRPNQLQSQVRRVATEAEALEERADDLDPPGKLKSANQSLVQSLAFRANAMNALADGLPDLLANQNQNFVAASLAEPMQRLLTSDVIYQDSFIAPATQALEKDNIVGVELPGGEDVLFLPGTNANLASPQGARTLVPKLQRRGASTSGNQSGGSSAGNLRGTSLEAVEAIPQGAALSTSQETTVQASDSLKWKVTVLNGGDFDESNVLVTARISYPGNPDDTESKQAEIQSIASQEQATVEIDGPTNPRLGEQANLLIEVRKVDGETNVQNNRAEYPVVITF
jgi:hypothetical protein